MLPKITAQNELNKWNRALFVLLPKNDFEIEFIWDKEWQDEIDSKNAQEELKDPNYIDQNDIGKINYNKNY